MNQSAQAVIKLAERPHLKSRIGNGADLKAPRLDILRKETAASLTPLSFHRQPEEGLAQLIYKLEDGYFAASERRTDGRAVGY